MGFACAVHLHLAGPGASAHSQIFQSAAKACALMSLKVIQGDNDIRIHQSLADFSLLYVFAPFHGNQRFVRTLKSVCDDHMAAGGER